MKAFNLMALAIAGAVTLMLVVSTVADMFLDKNTAMLVVAPIALLVGMSARRVTEKILGYTLLEAMREGDNDTNGN